MNSPRAVVFDLDGTLVDSVADITAGINHALKFYGRAPVSCDHVRPWIGVPPSFYFDSIGLGHESPAAVALFREHLFEHVGTYSQAYPGATEALAGLARAGWRLGVATNKPAHLARVTLERLSLDGFFEAIVGLEDGLEPKPDPCLVHLCLNLLGCMNRVMVSDTGLDMQAGRAAGLTSVLITHGMATPCGINDQADHIVASFPRLSTLLHET